MSEKFDGLRSFYRFKRHFAMGAAILPWVRKRLKKTLQSTEVSEIVRTDSDLLFPVNSRETAMRNIQVKGTIDPAMEWVIRRYVKPGTAAVDVGANLGFASALIADRVGDDGSVVIVEPNAELHPFIINLFHLNGLKKPLLKGVLCSDEEGEARLLVDPSDHTLSKISEEGGVKVPKVPLDKLLEKSERVVSFVKIDVEGHEAEVLKGANTTFTSHRPVLVFETGTHTADQVKQINELLDQYEYTLVGILHDWGVEPCELSTTMTSKTHVDVLAIPKYAD